MTEEKSPTNGDVTNLEDNDLENVAGGTSEIKSVNGGNFEFKGSGNVTVNVRSPFPQDINTSQHACSPSGLGDGDCV
jgi:hypothetical protein